MNIEKLIKYFNGQSLPEEAMQIHEWKSMNTDNLNVYNHIAKVWNPEYNYQNDTKFLELWNQLQGKKPNKRNWWMVSGIAAGILALIAFMIFFNQNNSIQIQYAYSANNPSVILPDSNKVILSENASITYFQKNDSTHISCMGDVQFNILHHQNNLNFSIGHDIYIKDIGTFFTIKNEPTNLTIEVVDGKILATRFDYSTEVAKNEKLIFDIEKKTFSKQKRTINLNWENVFLDKAIQELEDYFLVKIALKEHELTQKKISFIANDVTIDDVLQIISETLYLNYSIENDEILIY